MTKASLQKGEIKPKVKYRKDYQVPSYLLLETKLYFSLDHDKTTIKSTLSFQLNPKINTSEQNDLELVLNGEHITLVDIKLDGISLTSSSYRVSDSHLVINELPDEFVLQIETEMNPSMNTRLEGLYKSGDKYCTQCEAEGFRTITYYPDRPDVMATFTTTIEADCEKYPYLLSNGNLIDSGELSDGRHFAVWNDPHPKPCYLFALVAGDFDLLEDNFITSSGRDISLKIYVDKGKLNQCHFAMSSLQKAMQWDQDVYGLEYDLDTYMIVAVNDFNMGAMENKGLNVFNTCYVLADEKTATDADFEGVESVIGHEYFHNWTGNRVTCRDWFQLSLKEGLTVFRDQEFSADMNSRAVKRVEDSKVIKVLQFAEDAGPMAHPIRPDSYIEMNNFYTLTVYNKGAEVIRMFHTILGEAGFQAGMNLYFKRHDGQAVTCEDFICAMEDANDVDFKLFRHWYHQAGTPSVDVESHWDPDHSRYTLSFSQSCQPTPGQTDKELFLIPMRLALFSENGDSLKLEIDTQNNDIDYSKNAIISENSNELILLLTESNQSIGFKVNGSEPVPSLLRGFSAPVQLNYNYSDQDRALLFKYDDDSYSNWDAGQSLMTKIILDMTTALQNDRPLVVPDILDHALSKILENDQLEPSLVAMNLMVPSLDYLIEQYQNNIPFDRLVEAYLHLKTHLAEKLKDRLIAVYKDSSLKATGSDGNASGWRKLQNACLHLLAEQRDEASFEIALNQYQEATNMTHSLAALKVIAHSNSTQKLSVLEDFYQRWQDEDLVLDKWFAVQATNPSDSVIDDIEQLMQHADFQLTNPNKTRALVASFAKNNPQCFHRKDGEGYRLVADTIIKLNKINPQIAARLTSSFNHWKNFDKQRSEQMKMQLNRIVKIDNISVDVFEIASKALA